MSRQTKKFILLYAVIITSTSLLLLAVGAEIVLRWKGTYSTWVERNFGKYVSPYATPYLANWYWLRRPNDATTYKQPEFDFALITNSFGIRDIEHPSEKPENEFRIITLGDSFTEGQGAAYENSYVKQLEKRLNASCAPNHIRIINGGVAGSDPFYSFTLLRDKLLTYKPDLVTVAMNASDITDIIARGGEERFLENGRVHFAEPPKDEWLFARSHLYRFILMNAFGYDWFGLSPGEHITKREQAVEQLSVAAQKFQALAAQENFALLVVLHPADQFEALKQKYSFDAGKLKQNLEAHQIQYVDLMPSFAGQAKMGMQGILKYYWEKDMHNNAEGYKVLAEGIAAFILDKKLITAKAKSNWRATMLLF